MMRLSSGFKFGIFWATVYGLLLLILPFPQGWVAAFLSSATYCAAMAARAGAQGRLPWVTAGLILGAIGFASAAWLAVQPPNPWSRLTIASLAVAGLGRLVAQVESRTRPEAWRMLILRAHEASVFSLLLGRHLSQASR